MPSKFQSRREFASITIPISTATSSSYELGGTHLVGILMPSAFTGTKLTIEGSIDGINFYQLYGSTSGTAKEIKVTANKFIEIESNYDNPFNFVRLVSSANELAERILQIVCHP
jgi:hypothetical protein